MDANADVYIARASSRYAAFSLGGTRLHTQMNTGFECNLWTEGKFENIRRMFIERKKRCQFIPTQAFVWTANPRHFLILILQWSRYPHRNC
mmetsp:Transcript_26939/g.70890  ORF Transcript_26939/g.70890 Transcript_26939/m.70890 type:complete len:91 (+) Transcript_26939:115-387(+)